MLCTLDCFVAFGFSRANQSASIALDNGKAYAKGRISFLITSVIMIQVLYLIFGDKTHFIYAILSCSLIFIFIEFISAWFLKQYKTFVDTAVYLMKIKCMFERYMLSYMLIKETQTDPNYQELLKNLQEEIKWPETYLLKNSDINFAKEAIETMSLMLKNLKDIAPLNKKDEKNK